MRAAAYAQTWRLIAATLAGVSRASPPAILALVILATDPPVMPPDLILLVAIFIAVPALAVKLIERMHTVRVHVRADHLLLERRGLQVDVPLAAIAAVAPWTVPLPDPGLSLRLQSGRRLRYTLATADPAPLLEALAAAGGVPSAREALRHPTVIYAAARRDAGAWRWLHYLAKFVLFTFLPAGVLFNAHQHIAYGASLGEYYLFGLAAYVGTFALYWVITALYLVLWAATWRLAGECIAFLSAWSQPGRAANARRAVEIVCRAAYYAGVPALLALRFLT